MNIWEIDQAIMECVNEDGEVIDIEKMNELQMEREKKCENIALWIKNLTAEAKAIGEEKKHLDERKAACERKAESLKAYLRDVLNGQKFSTSKVAVSYRKSTSVEILDAELIPAEYWKVNPEISKKDISDALKQGLSVPGCELKEKENIQVK